MIARIALLTTACLVSLGAVHAASPFYVGVLEDNELSPESLQGLHSELSSEGFTFLRPLMGALAGKGSAWLAPEAMTEQDALALPVGLTGVTGVEDLKECNQAWTLECSEYYPYIPGSLLISFDQVANRESAYEELRSRGFVWLCSECLNWFGRYIWDRWRYFPKEYRITEAIALAKGVDGVSWAMTGWRMWLHDEPVGDVTGDGRVNILDLILVRNLMGQDPTTGDNWRADLNQDGRINVLDLIFLRNVMNR